MKKTLRIRVLGKRMLIREVPNYSKAEINKAIERFHEIGRENQQRREKNEI